MRNDKRPGILLFAATALALVALMVSPVLATSFSDVHSNTFGDPDYPEAVSALSDLGIITGYPDATFGPHDPVTRQQFAKLIVKLMGYPVTGEEYCPFGDVSQGLSASDPLYPDKYIAVCATLGIARGVDQTHFAPYENISRAQAISMIVRAATESGVGLQSPTDAYYAGAIANSLFYDLEDTTHGPNVQIAEMNNLLWGIWPDQGNHWDIYAKATRGEVAQIMWRLRQLMASQTTTTTLPPTTTTGSSTTTTTAPMTTTTTEGSTTTTESTTTTTVSSTNATLIYSDGFSDSTSGWPIGSSASSTAAYRDGAYTLQCQAESEAWRAPDWEITDGRIVADITLLEGTGDDSCGIVFRAKDQARYEFVINARGYYGLWYHDSNSIAAVVPWTRATAVESGGATNRVEIALTGSTISLSVNGSLLTTVQDQTLASGLVGFCVTASGSSPAQAALDNIEVWSQ